MKLFHVMNKIRVIFCVLCAVLALMSFSTPAFADDEKVVDELALVEDVEDVMSGQAFLGRYIPISGGVQTGVMPRTLKLLNPDEPADPVIPDGASRHIPVALWLQLSVPVLRTRYGASVGFESQSTFGFNFAKELTPKRSRIWSTRWLAAITLGEDVAFVTLFSGVERSKQPPFWWASVDEASTHGAFGARANLYLDSDRGTEFGYSYQPLLSQPTRRVAVNSRSLGMPTHAAHRVWLEPGGFLRLSYVHHVVRFYQPDEPARRAHQLLVTVHFP